MKARDEQGCMRPGCTSPSYCRGLCHGCYQAASVLVRQGKTTWDKLVQAGKAEPPRYPKRGATQWFLEGQDAN